MDEIEIEIYETTTGKRPFEIWLEGLKEIHNKGQNFYAARSIKAWELWRLQNFARRSF